MSASLNAARQRLRNRFGVIRAKTKRAVYAALLIGAQRIADDAARRVIEPPASGRFYPSRGRKGALHQASAPGESPAADTGELDQSLSSRGDAVQVYAEAVASAPYAVPLELGTSKMAPRPFMRPAFYQEVPKVAAEVAIAVRNTLRGP